MVDTIICTDCETGGLHPGTDALLQVGLVAASLKDYKILEATATEIRSENLVVTSRSGGIHGIDVVEHNKTAISRLDARQSIATWLRKDEYEGAVILGYKVDFDIGFLDKLLGAESPTSLRRHRSLDVLSVYRFYQHLGLVSGRSATLSAACTAFDVYYPEGDRHTALGDALACAHLYMAMLRRGVSHG